MCFLYDSHVEKRTLFLLKRDFLELQCSEEKLVALSQLVSDSLDRLGGGRPPPGVSTLDDFGSQVWKCELLFVSGVVESL